VYLFLHLIKVESYLGEKSAYVFEGRGDDLSVSHQAPALPTRISEPFREWSEKGNIRIYTVHISGGEGRVIFHFSVVRLCRSRDIRRRAIVQGSTTWVRFGFKWYPGTVECRLKRVGSRLVDIFTFFSISLYRAGLVFHQYTKCFNIFKMTRTSTVTSTMGRLHNTVYSC
jgi:hypothetical protein